VYHIGISGATIPRRPSDRAPRAAHPVWRAAWRRLSCAHHAEPRDCQGDPCPLFAERASCRGHVRIRALAPRSSRAPRPL